MNLTKKWNQNFCVRPKKGNAGARVLKKGLEEGLKGSQKGCAVCLWPFGKSGRKRAKVSLFRLL